MKRRVAWIMALCLVLSALPACTGREDSRSKTSEAEQSGTAAGSVSGEQTAEEETVEISLWTYPVGSWGNSSSVSNLISGFRREYPQYRVSLKFLDYTTGDSEIEAAVTAAELPDLVLEGPERLVANWGSRGLMADLSDLWESPQAEQIYPEVRKACQAGTGEYYEFPICMTTHCMAINYDLFKAAGALRYIDEETHTWTTEGFIQAVKALRDYGMEQVAAVYCGGQGGDQGTRALVNNLYGGTFTNDAHTAYTVNSEENRKALELLQSLDGVRFDPEIVGGDEADLFGNGELAMAFCWNVSMELRQIVEGQVPGGTGESFDIFPMAFPTETGSPRLQGGIWGFGIFDNGDERRTEAAKAFIRYMTENDTQYKKAVQTSSYWPVRPLEGIYINDELMTEYSMFVQYMGDYYQVAPGWADVRTAWWNMLQEIGRGTDVAAALQEFDAAAALAAESAG